MQLSYGSTRVRNGKCSLALGKVNTRPAITSRRPHSAPVLDGGPEGLEI
jgi:hypothetical protein